MKAVYVLFTSSHCVSGQWSLLSSFLNVLPSIPSSHFLEIGSHRITLVGLQPVILLPQVLELQACTMPSSLSLCWDKLISALSFFWVILDPLLWFLDVGFIFILVCCLTCWFHICLLVRMLTRISFMSSWSKNIAWFLKVNYGMG